VEARGRYKPVHKAKSTECTDNSQAVGAEGPALEAPRLRWSSLWMAAKMSSSPSSTWMCLTWRSQLRRQEGFLGLPLGFTRPGRLWRC